MQQETSEIRTPAILTTKLCSSCLIIAFSFSSHSPVLSSFYQLDTWDTGRFKNLLRAQNWSMTGPTEDWGLLILKDNCLAFCDTIPASPVFRQVSIICSEKSRPRKVNHLARWSSVMKWQNRGWNSDPRFPPYFSTILSSIVHSTASQGDREDKKEQRGRKPQPKIQT